MSGASSSTRAASRWGGGRSVQEAAVAVVVALAFGYLVLRARRRRASGNCCGEKECPAAKGTVEKLERLRR